MIKQELLYKNPDRDEQNQTAELDVSFIQSTFLLDWTINFKQSNFEDN